MARYRLPPDWDKIKDCDFAEGDTLLEALAEARIFSISKSNNRDGWRLQEMCDQYFSVVLTPLQLYNLGAELQVLAMTSGREGISVKPEPPHGCMQQKPEPYRESNEEHEWHHISYRTHCPF